MGRHPHSILFHEKLREMGELHDLKQSDYGRPASSGDAGDPFANVRGSEQFGIPAWVGCAIRMNDKMVRLQAAARGQNLKNESVADSFMDLAVYAIIGLILYEQQNTSNNKGFCASKTIPEIAQDMTDAIARYREKLLTSVPKETHGC